MTETQGIIKGGTVTGGNIGCRTIVVGGTIHGGTLINCHIHGGTIYDLDAENVTIHGGVYRGGTVRQQTDIVAMVDKRNNDLVTLVRDLQPPYFRACIRDRPTTNLNDVEQALRAAYPVVDPRTQQREYQPLIDRVRSAVAGWAANG